MWVFSVKNDSCFFCDDTFCDVKYLYFLCLGKFSFWTIRGPVLGWELWEQPWLMSIIYTHTKCIYHRLVWSAWDMLLWDIVTWINTTSEYKNMKSWVLMDKIKMWIFWIKLTLLRLSASRLSLAGLDLSGKMAEWYMTHQSGYIFWPASLLHYLSMISEGGFYQFLQPCGTDRPHSSNNILLTIMCCSSSLLHQ